MDYQIAHFFWEHPTRAALPAIETALERRQEAETQQALRGAYWACKKAFGG